MKLYREGSHEIRICLTREDLQAYQVTSEELDYDSPKGKRIFRELFDRAKKETGFHTAGERIYIQLLPCEAGGCELYITKLETPEKSCCFYFNDFDTLFTALSHGSAGRKTRLWKYKKKGCFYALLPEKEIPAVFWEFGEKIKAPSEYFLRSQCRRVHWEERKIDDGRGAL